MLEADSDAAALAKLGTLPLIKAGMMEIDAIVPLAPYPGFGPRT